MAWSVDQASKTAPKPFSRVEEAAASVGEKRVRREEGRRVAERQGTGRAEDCRRECSVVACLKTFALKQLNTCLSAVKTI